jgi:cytochrome bd ubiquinol oxidase subunit I
MDVLTLSRIQFGATIAFHYIYPPLSIGLGLMLVCMEGAWLRTKNPVYHQMARYWTKVFSLTFAIGVATGIVMEFELGDVFAIRRRCVRQRARRGRHLCILSRIRFSRGAAVWLG